MSKVFTSSSPVTKIIWAFDPLEGSEGTRAGVAQALAFFNEKTQAPIEPVYVLSPSDLNIGTSFSKPYVQQVLPTAKKVMKDALKRYRIGGLRSPRVLVEESPLMRRSIDSLLGHAKTEKADLIVTGTHARKGVSRLFLGSFAESLILRSKVPVLVVNPANQARPIKKILFPTDFRSQSKPLFLKACALARKVGAEITLLHVIPHPIEAVVQSGVYLLAGGWVSVPDYMKGEEQRLRKVAEIWKSQAASAGVSVTTLFDAGAIGVKESILRHAKLKKFDLIAMSAQSGRLAAAFLGSVSRQVLRDAPCAVWVMRR